MDWCCSLLGGFQNASNVIFECYREQLGASRLRGQFEAASSVSSCLFVPCKCILGLPLEMQSRLLQMLWCSEVCK